MIQRKTAQTFRNQLDKVFLTLFCTLVILTSAKKNKQEMENEMVTPTYSEKFTVILISFLLDVREFVYSPNVVFSDSCSTGGLCHLWNQLFGTLRIQMMILVCFGRSVHGNRKNIITIFPITDGKMAIFRKTSLLWRNPGCADFVLILTLTRVWQTLSLWNRVDILIYFLFYRYVLFYRFHYCLLHWWLSENNSPVYTEFLNYFVST